MADIPRIKNNVRKMLDQNAPESDVDEYLASEGVTAEQLRAAPGNGESSGSFTNNIGRAVARGVPIVGSFLDEAQAAANATLDPVLGPVGEMLGGKRIPGNTWDERYTNELANQRGMDAKFDKENQVASMGAQLAGGIASGVGLARQAPMTAKYLLGLGGKTLPAKMAAGGLSGGAIGAGHGFGMGEGGLDERVKSAQWQGGAGLGMGAASPLIAAGVSKALNPVLGKVKTNSVPSNDALGDAAQAAYRSAEDAGVVFKGSSFKDMASKVARELADDGLDPTLHPRASAVLKRLTGAEGDLTFKQVETLRKVVNSVLSSPDKGERRFAYIMRDSLDDFVKNPGQSGIVSGDSRAASSAIEEARSLWARKSKSDVIERAIQKASDTTGQYSQSGRENALRSEFRKLVRNDRVMRRFSKTEQDAIKRVANGTFTANTLRQIGKLAPTGNIPWNTLITAATGGTLAGGPIVGGAVGVGLGGAGLAGYHGAKAVTSNNAQLASQLMRQGGPVPVSSNPREAIIRAMLQGGNPATSAAVIPGRQPALSPNR